MWRQPFSVEIWRKRYTWTLPEGMEGAPEECLPVLKSFYGLAQAARQWWKKFVAILKNLGFKVDMLILAS